MTEFDTPAPAPPAPALTWLAALPKLPVLLGQGRRLRRDTPRLPDAAMPWSGTRAGPSPVRLLVLGDSTAAGVGARTQEYALPGWFAQEIHARWGRGTHWRAVGANGATAADVRARFLGEATSVPLDLTLLTIGANDALGMRSRGAFARDVRAIAVALLEANPESTVMVSLLPRFDRYELLPQPLRDVLARHAASLDVTARAALDGMPGVITMPPPPPYTTEFFASDLFHPSEEGYRQWAEFDFDQAPDLDLGVR